MFEAIEFVEHRGIAEPSERPLGEEFEEMDAVELARAARLEFVNSGSDEYAWWVVREVGATLAQFIADSKSNKEFVLDLTSGQLVEV
jgi:hypothetical protein